MNKKAMRRRMAQHPNAVTFREARQLLEAYGWTVDRVKGRHHIFVRRSQTQSVPHRRPTILAVYVRQILRLTEGEDDD